MHFGHLNFFATGEAVLSTNRVPALAHIPQCFSPKMALPDRVVKQDSPLLKLPAELRNRIYEEALTSNTSVCLRPRPDCTPCWSPPALLMTCQTVRNEASPIYYAKNVFKVKELIYSDCDDVLITWLGVLEPGTRQQIRRIYLDDKFYNHPDVIPRIEECLCKLRRAELVLQKEVIFVEMRYEGERLSELQRRRGPWFEWMNMQRARQIENGEEIGS